MGAMIGRLLPMVLLLALLAPGTGFPLDTAGHRQLVVSLTGSWDDSRATLHRFEQSGGEWLRVGPEMPALVGRNGLGWDRSAAGALSGEPVKREGDGRAPAGIFPLPLTMGFSLLPPAGTTLPYRVIAAGTHCVDDPASAYYNRIVAETELPGKPEALWRSSERMWELDLYRNLVVVGYNTFEPKRGDGSCIFIHIRRGPAEPTSGCTALSADDLALLIAWFRPDLAPALVQLPRPVYERMWRRWRLPPPSLFPPLEFL